PKKVEVIILIFLTGFIGIIHPLITKPLIKTSFGFYRFSIILNLSRVLLITFGFVLIYEIIKNKKARQIFIFASVLLVMFHFFSYTMPTYRENKWTKVGQEMNAGIGSMFAMADWIEKNIQDDGVFISPHGETAFALNALTGKKVMHMRITHANPFVDSNKRIAEAAVILYGNNSEEIKRLLKKYDVKYLYEDQYSFQSQKQCLENWALFDTEEFGDMSYNCLRTTPEYKKYLQANGIQVKKVHARLDVASNKAPKFDLIAIKPGKSLLKKKVLQRALIQNTTIISVSEISI
ncbi:hypothetical protein D6745_00540, partial [Candidatus Woesearchaeota archaeon]